MNILLIGDIIGSIGMKAVKDFLPQIKQKYKVDFIIANAENSADGMGITEKIYNNLISMRNKCNHNGKPHVGKKGYI